MPVLSDREYKIFVKWFRGEPGKIFQTPPKNVEGIREGSPYKQFLVKRPFARITPRTQRIFEETGPLPPKAVVAPESPQERTQRGIEARREAARVDLAAPPTGVGVPSFPTEPPPPGFEYRFDRDLNRYVPQRIATPSPITPFQQQQLGLQQQQLAQEQAQFETGRAGFPPPTGAGEGFAAPAAFPPGQQQAQDVMAPRRGIGGIGPGPPPRVTPTPTPPEAPPGAPTDPFGRTATWNSRLGQWDYPPSWGQRPADQPAPITPFQRQQFDIQQEQFAQQQAQFQAQLEFQQEQARQAAAEQERQYRSQLAANPINWLQYSAYTGEAPVIQPWMIPLGFQNQGGTVAPQGFQAGQPIPGFQGQAGQQDIQTFANLPQLTTPSAQLQARWGPTASAQFLGYRQARTGASPAETQFRLGSGRAPTGRFGGFSRFR